MNYFLLRQNRQNGELGLITRVVYDSQQEALQALSLESSRPEFQHEDFDFCIGCMDATIPVLIVLSAAAEPLPLEPPEPLLVPVPPQPLVAPLQDSPELQEESDAVSESVPVPYEDSDAVLEKIIEQPEAEGEQVAPSKDDSLSGALKRAAGQLEAEGIKAPESVGPAIESWPWESDTKTIEEPEPLSEAAQEQSDEALEPLSEGAQEQSEESPEPLSEAAQEQSDASYVFDPLEEPSVDSDALLPSKAKMSVLEDLTIITPDSTDSNTETDQPISATEPSAPGPDIQCDDCVYVSTCPNKEGANPATCGNFQWKAV